MNNWIDFSEGIMFCDKLIIVKGSWLEGDSGSYSTWNDPLGNPPEPPDIEIESVSYNDVDVTDFLCYEFLEDIKNKTLEELQEY
jgi:hypothetical protein